jgi:hypothetical protein
VCARQRDRHGGERKTATATKKTAKKAKKESKEDDEDVVDWKIVGARWGTDTHQWQYLTEMTEGGTIAGPKHPRAGLKFVKGMRWWLSEFDGRPQYRREMQYAKQKGWMQRAKEELDPAVYQRYRGTVPGGRRARSLIVVCAVFYRSRSHGIRVDDRRRRTDDHRCLSSRSEKQTSLTSFFKKCRSKQVPQKPRLPLTMEVYHFELEAAAAAAATGWGAGTTNTEGERRQKRQTRRTKRTKWKP